MSRGFEEPELPKNMIKYKIDPIDIFILNKLHDKTYGWEGRKDLTLEEKELLDEKERKQWLREGASITTLDKMIKKELNIDITRPEVERRIEKLARDGILLSLHSLVIDPSKLFDHIAHIYLKIPIYSPVRAPGATLGWWESVKTIWAADKESKLGESPTDIIRLAGVVEGTGDYDLILLVYTNDMEEISRFLRKLTDAGLIEKSMTQRIWAPTGVKFDPIRIPEFETYSQTISKYAEVIESMKKIV